MLTKNLSVIALLALAATTMSGRANADPRRGYAPRRDSGWLHIGDVGTHTHDADDYVPVQPAAPLEAIQLRASGHPVAVDGVRVEFADGRSDFAEVHRNVRPGEALTVDLPHSGERVKMLVIDYGNQGPYWRARETAHVEILGLTGGYGERGRDRYRTRDRIRTDDRDRAIDEAPASGAHFEIRGGVRVRVP